MTLETSDLDLDGGRERGKELPPKFPTDAPSWLMLLEKIEQELTHFFRDCFFFRRSSIFQRHGLHGLP